MCRDITAFPSDAPAFFEQTLRVINNAVCDNYLLRHQTGTGGRYRCPRCNKQYWRAAFL